VLKTALGLNATARKEAVRQRLDTMDKEAREAYKAERADVKEKNQLRRWGVELLLIGPRLMATLSSSMETPEGRACHDAFQAALAVEAESNGAGIYEYRAYNEDTGMLRREVCM
jgi:hypothetical protein